MERLERKVSIHISGTRHNRDGLELIPWIRKNAETFFRKNGKEGTNIFFFEGGDGTESRRQALTEFSNRMSFLEAYLQANLWVGSNYTRTYSPQRLEQLTREVVNRDDNDAFVYRRIAIADELRDMANLKIDQESYSDEVAQMNVARFRLGTQLNSLAADLVLGGRAKQAPQPYYQNLVLEADLNRDRHGAIAQRVRDYTLNSEHYPFPLKVYMNFGDGHVRALARTIGNTLGEAGIASSVSTSYATGEMFLHRYEVVYLLEQNPKAKPDQKKLMLGLLQEMFVDLKKLQDHPLVSSLTFAQKLRLIYTYLDQLSQKELDRIVESISKEGSDQALTKLIRSNRQKR